MDGWKVIALTNEHVMSRSSSFSSCDFLEIRKKNIDRNPGKKSEEKITCHFRLHACWWNMKCLLPPVIEEQQVCGSVVDGFCWQTLILAFNEATDILALPRLLFVLANIFLSTKGFGRSEVRYFLLSFCLCPTHSVHQWCKRSRRCSLMLQAV